MYMHKVVSQSTGLKSKFAPTEYSHSCPEENKSCYGLTNFTGKNDSDSHENSSEIELVIKNFYYGHY